MQEVPDPEILVTFPIVGDSHNASLVAWTTTPWTLPSNLALCVNANFVYVKVRFLVFLFKQTGSLLKCGDALIKVVTTLSYVWFPSVLKF